MGIRKEMEVVGIMSKIVKLDNIREAIEFLERGFGKRVDFDAEVEGIAKYKARMYKTTTNVIRIDLVREENGKEYE